MPEAGGDPRRDPDREVRPGAISPSGRATSRLDRVLVLDRDHLALVGEAEAGGRVTVRRDDAKPSRTGRPSSPSCAGPAPRTRIVAILADARRI